MLQGHLVSLQAELGQKVHQLGKVVEFFLIELLKLGELVFD